MVTIVAMILSSAEAGAEWADLVCMYVLPRIHGHCIASSRFLKRISFTQFDWIASIGVYQPCKGVACAETESSRDGG